MKIATAMRRRLLFSGRDRIFSHSRERCSWFILRESPALASSSCALRNSVGSMIIASAIERFLLNVRQFMFNSLTAFLMGIEPLGQFNNFRTTSW